MKKIITLIVALLPFSGLGQSLISLGSVTFVPTGGGVQYSYSTNPGNPQSDYTTDEYQLAIGPDGHGTFHITFETGVHSSHTYVLTFTFPQAVSIAEVHGHVEFDPWCNDDGFLWKLDGAANHPPGQPDIIESLVGAKSFIPKKKDPQGLWGPGDHVLVPLSAKFAYPRPVNQLYMYSFTDICSVSSFNGVLDGSF